MKYHILYVLLVLTLSVALPGCTTGRPKMPANARKIERLLEVTGYCKCGKCCNWRHTWYGKPVIASGPNKGKRKKVGITASGKKAKPGTIAADTALYPFGTVMYIPGYGYGRVEDRGGAIKGQKIDLYFKSHKAALQWGRQRKRVTIWLPE